MKYKFTIDEYRQALQSHDWFYDCSEDPRYYSKGRDQRTELYLMRYQLDKDYAIWNELAPDIFHITDEDSHGDT